MRDAAATASNKAALVPHPPSVVVAGGGRRPPAGRHVGEAGRPGKRRRATGAGTGKTDARAEDRG